MSGDVPAAQELARWKAKVRDAWAEVRIEHVESSGVSDSPALGSILTVHVYASLGELAADDVDVQVVHGRLVGDDELRDPQVVSLDHTEGYADGRHRFDAGIELDFTGQFGYTVRILPKHPFLVSAADVGVIAWAHNVNDPGRP